MSLAPPSGKRKGTGRRRRKKVCVFCKDKIRQIDYKAETLGKYLTERGKIVSRRTSGCCAAHQRVLAVAIRNAREMALLPYLGREKE